MMESCPETVPTRAAAAAKKNRDITSVTVYPTGKLCAIEGFGHVERIPRNGSAADLHRHNSQERRSVSRKKEQRKNRDREEERKR
jgi:hypothetical protein